MSSLGNKVNKTPFRHNDKRVRGCDRGNRGRGLVRGLYKGDKGKGAAVALYPIITLAAILRGLLFPNVGRTRESFNTF